MQFHPNENLRGKPFHRARRFTGDQVNDGFWLAKSRWYFLDERAP